MSDSKYIIGKAREIYEELCDRKSKQIFLNKLLYAVTEEEEYLFRILEEDMKGFCQDLARKVQKDPDTEFVIYGAGNNCPILLYLCKKMRVKIACICDRDSEKQTSLYAGLPVISPEELVECHRQAVVLISTTAYQEEVAEYLKQFYPMERIRKVRDEDVARGQYFDREIIRLQDGEVFVDCGCFDFETSKILLSFCKPAKIYAFEPDQYNLKRVREEIADSGFDDVVLYDKGVWDNFETLCFNERGDIMSGISQNGETMVEVVPLDGVITEKVTFLKMDIEGAEMKALRGAREIIKRDKPKLAICIYHKQEDLIDIPAYIKELVPEYRLYIRHYSNSPAETVLYAVIQECRDEKNIL